MRINTAQRTGIADLFDKIATGLVWALFFIIFINDQFSWLKVIMISTSSLAFIVASVCLRGSDNESLRG